MRIDLLALQRSLRSSAVSVATVVWFCVFWTPAKGVDPQSTPVPGLPRNPQQLSEALDDPRPAGADLEANETWIKSGVTFDYRYYNFNDDSTGNAIWIEWLQSFGHSNRLAALIEFPIVQESGPGVTGPGDVRLEFRGMLGNGKRFRHAAGIKITLPSGSSDLIHEGHIVDGQMVAGVTWGCTAQLTRKTTLDATLGYHRAMHSRGYVPKRNYVEPGLIITQALAKRVAGYADWGQNYEFTGRQYAPTLKATIELVLDAKEKWSIGPYMLFPLNRTARLEETKLAAGVVLGFRF